MKLKITSKYFSYVLAVNNLVVSLTIVIKTFIKPSFLNPVHFECFVIVNCSNRKTKKINEYSIFSMFAM
jgi:hypothetical protein